MGVQSLDSTLNSLLGIISAGAEFSLGRATLFVQPEREESTEKTVPGNTTGSSGSNKGMQKYSEISVHGE